ncbi:MAG: ELM1/GtrOC1 family putative glycosyltransferase [Candidatus Omnitrophica bacterium]|nr:ELM1/GtrOC1 family putative glycosyltransferase [Candidatus Omnitrophota bacterium]
MADYISCALFRALSLLTRFLPPGFSLFMGRRLGDAVYFFDRRHRAIACSNIRRAVAENGGYISASRITRKAYQSFGQNLVEISFIPRIDRDYLEKYIHFENRNYIDEAFGRGKGVIFLAVHEGNWELSNIICANLGFPFVLFVRDQGFPRLNALLNSYRLKRGAQILHKKTGLRQLIEVLKENKSIGMTFDQGGKRGEIVDFFGRRASMSTGAVKLALKYDCSIIPVFYTRERGPRMKVILDSVYTAVRSGNPGEDLRENVSRLSRIYEKYLCRYPYEYLWTYKIWKYGRERDVLVLSDGKAGHLRQSESVAGMAGRRLSSCGIKVNLSFCEVSFRSRGHRILFGLLAALSGRNSYGFCWRYAGRMIREDSLRALERHRPDIIISAGDRLSAVNYIFSRVNQAKSIILMRPSGIGTGRFDLAVIPRHDRGHLFFTPAGNTVITEGALNPVDAGYLKEKTEGLKHSGMLKGVPGGVCIGVLIGGNSRGFRIGADTVRALAGQIKRAAEDLDAGILITTSRRTQQAAEQEIKKEFAGYPRCRLMVIANEKNHPDTVGGILGLSSILVTSPESISMISESAASGKRVIVFDGPGLSAKHRRFLDNFSRKKYISLCSINDLAYSIGAMPRGREDTEQLRDNFKVFEALERVL